MQSSFLDQLVSLNPGISAEDLQKLCQNDPRTVKSISGSDLVVWLASNALTPRLQRSAAAISASGKAADIRSGDVLSAFVTYALSVRNFDTDQTAYAAQAQAMLSGLLGAYQTSGGVLGVSADEAAFLIALGGGYRVFDATAEECKGAIERGVRQAAWNALNSLRVEVDNARSAKLFYLSTHADVVIPSAIAELDALEVK